MLAYSITPLVSVGLGCGTVMNADGAALAAAQILGLSDHRIWSRLRAQQLNTWISLRQADEALNN